MIFDCFTFFNELDILELRLHVLYSTVDRFVLVESTRTHSNDPKELFYEKNKHRFERFSDKIIHVVIDEFPEYKNSWTYENFQRNAIGESLQNCSENDLIIISDVDEIPDPAIISHYPFHDQVYRLVQDQYFFFYNYRDINHLFWTGGTQVFKYKIIKENLLNEKKVRYNDISFPRYLNQGATLTKIRLYDGGVFIFHAGWHFSYLGGVNAIVKKIRAFAHQELNNDYFLNRKRIEECLVTGVDIFGRPGHKFIRTKINAQSHPHYLDLIRKEHRNIFDKTSVQTIPVFTQFRQLLTIRVKRAIKRLF